MQVSDGVTLHFGEDATTDLTMVLATRHVFERALCSRLLALHLNIRIQTGTGVRGLEHGHDDAAGSVTGTFTVEPPLTAL